MRYINRWSLMRSYENENVAEHSHCVAIMAHALCVIENKLFGGSLDENKAAVIALYHETSEVITGDLPTPIKYFNNGITDAYKQLESQAEEKMLRQLPDELVDSFAPLVCDKSSDEYRFVKYADKLAAYVKCIEEINAGNPEFNSAFKTIGEWLDNADSRSVNYFKKNFIDAFYLTLDKLQED